MNDLGISIVRSTVPIIVGYLAALGAKTGLEFNVEGLEGFLIPLLSSAYYIVARILERRWPVLGWLLGVPKEPTYPTTPE